MYNNYIFDSPKTGAAVVVVVDAGTKIKSYVQIAACRV